MPDHSKTVATRSTLDFKFSQLIRGFVTPFRALDFIFKHPKLLRLSIAPFLVAVILFILIVAGLLAGVWAFVHSALLAVVSDYSGLLFILAAVLVLFSLGMFASTFMAMIMSLASSPFNDVLAEKTEEASGMKDIPSWSAGRFIRVFWIDLRKTIITLFSAIVFSLGMLIPVANIVFYVGLALLNTFTFITYPQSRREKGLMESLQWIRENFFLSLGFGITITLLFTIPIVDFFALPIAVVGGTLLYCDSVKDTDRPSTS